MRILFSDVLDSIYARSALATLGELSKAPLLHPDHSRALLRTVRDMFSLLAPRLPAGVEVRSVDDGGADLDITDKTVDIALLAEAVRASLASATLQAVSVAAGLGGNVINTLAESFSTLYKPALIVPSRY